MTAPASTSEIHQMISAQETELRQSISRDVNTLAAFAIAQQRLGWLGWVARVCFDRSVRRVRGRIEMCSGLLVINREVRDLLNFVERATP